MEQSTIQTGEAPADAASVRRQELAREIAAEIRARYRPRDPAHTPGFARGIDMYRPEHLVLVIDRILADYHEKTGRYPNLLAPELYSEKVNALKLLAPIKVPETGNKLLTGAFLTAKARELLKVPEVVWHSRVASLPPNGAIPDGEYYLKSNHGSDRCRRIRYPLDAAERAQLENMAAGWLKRAHGARTGEWWYNIFERRLLLERCVTRRNPSAVMLFYVFRGVVRSISIDEKLLDGTGRTRCSLFDRDFRLLPEQPEDDGPVRDFTISDEMKANALAAAESIGRNFDAVRVDIIPGDEGELYLNEITLTSNAGIPLRSPDRDRALGEMWGPCTFIREAPDVADRGRG